MRDAPTTDDDLRDGDDWPDEPHRMPERDETVRSRARRRILQSTAVLPAMVTVLNGLAGFAAIHFATKDALGSVEALDNIRFAAVLIFAAMVFDMLDGRLARMTRRTSDFGGQLDSLCDMVSFGAAPAILMLRTVVIALRGGVLGAIEPTLGLERVVWCIGGAYVACTALRLARFNVENEPDESAHMDFHGLPSPGAAAAVASLVLLFHHLRFIDQGRFGSPWLKGWLAGDWASAVVGLALPVVTLAAALLMVSNFRYLHVVNHYIRGRRPFSYLVKLVVLLMITLLEPFVVGAVVMTAYALSGPVASLFHRGRPDDDPEPI
jgi:CDP-diacylglycerol---serine O-phosphatidyltransferase